MLTTIPWRSSALNHEDPWPALSRRGSVTTVSASGGSFPQNASIASAPSAPGPPEARRSSISFLSPKSERLAPLAASSPQWKPRSAARTARSENPLARARARIASAASSASSGSSPWITYSARNSRARCASSCSSLSAAMRLLDVGQRPLRRDQAPHDLLHHVALHVPVEQRFLGFLGEDLRVAVGDVAGQQDFARRQVDLRAFGIGDAESDPIAQLIFAHPARIIEGKNDFFAQLLGEAEHGLRVARAPHNARLARHGDVAFQLDHERVPAWDVERLERQLRLATKMETASCEERGHHAGKGRARGTLKRPH